MTFAILAPGQEIAPTWLDAVRFLYRFVKNRTISISKCSNPMQGLC